MEKEKKFILIISSVVAVVIIAFLVYFIFFPRKATPPPEPETSVSQTQPAEEAEEPDPEVEASPITSEIPPLEGTLNESDTALRDLLKGASDHSYFYRWLENKDLIRTFVAAVANIANGNSPAPLLPFMDPKEKFKTREKEGRTIMDARSYNRYSRAAAVFLSIAVERVAPIYSSGKPLFEEAYRELGLDKKSFDQVLFNAMSVLMNTPVVRGDIVLEERLRSFHFVDQQLENLNAAQKQFLRLGPANVEKMIGKLKQWAGALGFPVNRLPRTRIYRADN